MATQFLLTTTGTLNPVPINDLGLAGPGAIPHPTASRDMLLEFLSIDILSSINMQGAIDSGFITVLDESGNSIINVRDIITNIGGLDTQIQYNNTGFLGGTSGITFNGTNLQISSGTPGLGKVLTSDAVGVATWQDTLATDVSDITPLFLIDQVSPTNLADILIDGNYCIRNSPADLAAQGITGHTNGDILNRDGGVWTFVLTPVAGVTQAIFEDDAKHKLFFDDPTPGDSPVFNSVPVPGEPFSVYAKLTNPTGTVAFDGTNYVVTGHTGGLVSGDINGAVVLVSGIFPYWLEDTVNPERSGAYNLIINDIGGATFTFRRDFNYDQSNSFVDGQQFFIGLAGGTEANKNYLIVLDQQFILNTGSLSVVVGVISKVANASTIATEVFANTNSRFFGELGLPATQQTWVDTATGSTTIDLVTEDVFSINKQVVRHNDNFGNGLTTSQITLTAQNWIDINAFGAYYSGISRLDNTDGFNGFFSGLSTDAAENPLATGNRRYGISFNSDAGNLRLTEADTPANTVTMDGTLGNPTILFNEWFEWECIVPAGLGAAQLYINGSLTTFVPVFGINTGGLGTRAIVSSGSTSGVDKISYHDNFGVTILEESTIKTISIASMSADVLQVITPPVRRDFEVIVPDGAGRSVGASIKFILNNVGGSFKARTFNLSAPQVLFNGLREYKRKLLGISDINFLNTIEGGNVYAGDFGVHPELTTAERLALASPKRGIIVIDITTDQFMGYNGIEWVIIG